MFMYIPSNQFGHKGRLQCSLRVNKSLAVVHIPLGLNVKVSQKVMTVLRYLRSDVASNEKEGRCKQYHSSLIYA
jgi:hypothetical protein